MNKAEPSQAVASRARALVESTLDGLVAGDSRLLEEAAQPPNSVKPQLDALLSEVNTYRDGMLTLLAFPLAKGSVVDLTQTLLPGARGVAQAVAARLRHHNIPGRKDALQTIAKGSPNYLGRKNPVWNELLVWASGGASLQEVRRAWLYLMAGVAATGKSVV